jgi:4-diphosphocytidyl-2-C-methyl-D-erythritol kinase
MNFAAMSVWPAPAKLNLFLHILGRRQDGYHQLQTLFQFVDLCDEITIGVRSDGAIHRLTGAAGIAVEEDLVVRAASALQRAAHCRLGADLGVRKRIPVGAGLGGGSSDAATTLVALNQLWNLDWPRERLAELGLSLGADVPVFVHGRTAWAEGIGERLTPLYPPQAPQERNYLILKPNVDVSTAAVFQDAQLTRNSLPITISGFFLSGGRNDCTQVVCQRYPQVAAALDFLSTFGDARLTGTGACVFLACATTDAAHEIMRQLPTTLEGFLARGLNDSPLLEKLVAG